MSAGWVRPPKRIAPSKIVALFVHWWYRKVYGVGAGPLPVGGGGAFGALDTLVVVNVEL